MTEKEIMELAIRRMLDAQYNIEQGPGLLQVVTDIPEAAPNGTIT